MTEEQAFMLKKIILRYFTLFMALVVLASSTGVGLVENQCMMRGKTVSLVFKDKKKGCKLCSAPRHARKTDARQDIPVLKKSHCCVEKHQLKMVEYQVPAGKQLDNTLKSVPANGPPIFTFAALLHPGLSGREVSPSPPHSFSSLFFGRATLSFIQSFLI